MNNLNKPNSWLLIIVLLLIPMLFLSSCAGTRSRDNQIAPTSIPPLATLAEVGATPQTPTAVPPLILPTIPPTSTEFVPLDPTPTLTARSSPQISTCNTPGEIQLGSFPSQINGELMNYRIYLPPCYGEDNRTYPAIYLFHGSFHSDSHWDDLGIDETAEILINRDEIPSVLIIMPHGGELFQETSGGPSSFEGVILRDLVPHIEHNYCAWSDPNGRAIGGLSRGGYWALEIAFRNPQNFQSVGGHSAALLDESAGSEYDPMVTAQKSNIDDLRIYLDAGRNDYVLSPLLEFHEVLLEADREHQWILNEGRHEDNYWSAHLKEYLTWYTDPWPPDRALYPLCTLDSPDR